MNLWKIGTDFETMQRITPWKLRQRVQVETMQRITTCKLRPEDPRGGSGTVAFDENMPQYT